MNASAVHSTANAISDRSLEWADLSGHEQGDRQVEQADRDERDRMTCRARGRRRACRHDERSDRVQTATSSTSRSRRIPPASTANPGPATIGHAPESDHQPEQPEGLSTPRSPPLTAMIAAKSGTVATSNPVSPDGSVCSACPSSRNGPAISMAPNASTQPIFGRRAERLRRIANGSSSTAPPSVRPATTRTASTCRPPP